MDALEKPQAEHRAGTGWAVMPLLLPSAARRPGLPAVSPGDVLAEITPPPLYQTFGAVSAWLHL